MTRVPDSAPDPDGTEGPDDTVHSDGTVDSDDNTENAAGGTSESAESSVVSAESTEGSAESADEGEVLFEEPGGTWWVVTIGPVLVLVVLIMELTGPGQVHWPVLLIFLVILGGFSWLQVAAARRHVSVRLTETTLHQGTRDLPLTEITKILPANNGVEPEIWESAPALGELHAVPRRRKGIGVELAGGTLAQAWARDVEKLRRELTEAHTAVTLGLPPRGKSST